MGKKIHIDEVRKFARTTPVFTARDVESLVKDKRYALLMLHNLAEKGELHRITRGFYTVHGDPTLSVFAFRPAYIGLQDALSVRHLWEQETNPVVVTAGRAKPGIRTVMGGRVILHRISPSRFFGFDYVPYDETFYLPVSDLEKTLIDLIYFGETPGKDVMRKLARTADRRLLAEYLSHYDDAFVRRFRRSGA